VTVPALPFIGSEVDDVLEELLIGEVLDLKVLVLVEVHDGLVTLGESRSIEDAEGNRNLMLASLKISRIGLELSIEDFGSSETHLSQVLVDVNGTGLGLVLETVKLGLEEGALNDL